MINLYWMIWNLAVDENNCKANSNVFEKIYNFNLFLNRDTEK